MNRKGPRREGMQVMRDFFKLVGRFVVPDGLPLLRW